GLPGEYEGHGRRDGRAVEVDRAEAAAHFLERVMRPAVALEERKPLLREHVGVDVDDRAHEQKGVRAIFPLQIAAQRRRICFRKIALTPFWVQPSAMVFSRMP